MACACDVSGGGELSGQGAASHPAALCVHRVPGSTQEHENPGFGPRVTRPELGLAPPLSFLCS